MRYNQERPEGMTAANLPNCDPKFAGHQFCSMNMDAGKAQMQQSMHICNKNLGKTTHPKSRGTEKRFPSTPRTPPKS